METKICTKCGEELPATLEFFEKSKCRKDGTIILRSHCKICRKSYRRIYEQSDKVREYRKKYNRAYRQRPEVKARNNEQERIQS